MVGSSLLLITFRRADRKCVKKQNPVKHMTIPMAPINVTGTPKKIHVAMMANIRRSVFRLE